MPSQTHSVGYFKRYYAAHRARKLLRQKDREAYAAEFQSDLVDRIGFVDPWFNLPGDRGSG